MKVSNYLVVRSVFFVIFGSFSQYLSSAEINLVSLYPKAKVFEKSQKVHQTYQLIEGDIRYVTDLQGDADEGYVPYKTSMIEGAVERTVFDHTEADTAIEIAKNMRKELIRKGFDIVYECARQECGDIAGWRLYLSGYIDGTVDSQFYILAQHPNKSGGDWTIAFYVNEFTNIPRSILHVVNSDDIEFNHYVIDKRKLGERLERGESVPLEGLFFAFDSAEIEPSSYSILQSLMETLQSSPEMAIAIEGHTDSLGSEDYNLALSVKRANAVKDYLISKGIGESRLSVKGFGESKPREQSDTHKARAVNRRVEVVKVSENG